jgi:hypothetical protein
MSDSEIIWKYLDREYPNDHLVIYLYVCGNVRSNKKALTSVCDSIKTIFSPPINESIIKSTVTGFLENKLKLYEKGEIQVKSLY